jgi:hypothetical protein
MTEAQPRPIATRPAGPAAQPPPLADRSRPRHLASLAIAIVGVGLLLTGDFAGWTERLGDPTFPRYVDHYVRLGSGTAPGYASALLLLLVGALAAAAVASAAALGDDQHRRRWTHTALVFAITVLIGTTAGALVFIDAVGQEFDWWLDAGFYGTITAALVVAALSALSLRTHRDTRTMVATRPSPTAGMLPDRTARQPLRYWDGNDWTEQ